ncbi:MAG TPA: hypothetical protein VM534_04445 [Thermoanaerobaculia bacterium]|nr:hypothetical protein [Thermoanaerobaculia bacterium]
MLRIQRIFLSLLLLSTALPLAASEPATAPQGEARVTWSLDPVAPEGPPREFRFSRGETTRSLELGELVLIPVRIDLTEVKVQGVPVTLGAWVVSMRFDLSAVRVIGVGAGDGSPFGIPTSTDPVRANTIGKLKLAAVQNDDINPAGIVDVARVLVRELEPGGAQTIEITLDSVASSVRDPITRRPLGDIRVGIEKPKGGVTSEE